MGLCAVCSFQNIVSEVWDSRERTTLSRPSHASGELGKLGKCYLDPPSCDGRNDGGSRIGEKVARRVNRLNKRRHNDRSKEGKEETNIVSQVRWVDRVGGAEKKEKRRHSSMERRWSRGQGSWSRGWSRGLLLYFQALHLASSSPWKIPPDGIHYYYDYYDLYLYSIRLNMLYLTQII